MNKKLQNILDIIQQSEKLDAEQKNKLLRAVKDADKELEITAFKLERTEKVKKTTAILLEETIEELEQKRKAVEEQNRELEIEASLERVRAQAMGMKKSDDLLNIGKAQFIELKQLGFSDLRNSLISIFNDDKGFFLDYDYSDFAGGSINNIDYDSHPAITNSVNKIRKGNDVLSEFSISGKELDEWNEYRRNKGEREDPRLENISALYYYMYSIGSGAIGISNFKPVNQEQLQILKRFRNVFDLAYKRYNDITQAEAQAREAKIEAGLERVRSLALGMRKSEDVGNVTDQFFTELTELSVDVKGCSMVVIDEDNDTMELWRARSDVAVKPFDSTSFTESMDLLKKNMPDWFSTFIKALRKRENYLIDELLGERRSQFIDLIAEQYKYSSVEKSQLLKNAPEKITTHYIFFKLGYLGLLAEKKLSIENLSIARRFVEVFDFAYTRFLDIKKAEAQAREAQIQLALERVRARTMAMHKSDELADTAAHLFRQLSELGIHPYRCNIGIVDAEKDQCKLWSTTNKGDVIPLGTFIPLTETPSFINIYAAWKKKAPHSVMKLVGKDRLEMIKYFIQFMPYAEFKPEEITLEKISQVTSIFNIFNFKQGFINIHTNSEVSDPDINVIKRFTKVFEQTYTRFLDLQKAEAQAREAQIQLALERVRARTMAMHKSDELAETATVLFNQLIDLGVEPNRLYIGIINDESGNADFWITDEDGSKVSSGFSAKPNDNPIFDKMFFGWKNKEKTLIIDMQGKELQEYFQYLQKLNIPFKEGLSQKRRVQSIAYFSQGFIGIASPELQPDETANLLVRFATVFNLTYRRFLDLQKAEAQAREAEIELALERVRARTMGMQKSEELKEVIKLVYEQFVHLKIIVDHAGFVVDYTPKGDWHFWIADQQEIPSKITHPYFDSVWAHQFNEAKEKGIDFFTTNLNFEEKNKFYTELLSYVPGLPEKSKDFYLSCPGLAATTVLFDNVSLYIENFSGTPYTDEENKILLRFGKVFQQTYTRFLDLQKAEAQARESQIELALERVRARTMAMHNSQDVGDTVVTLFDEVLKLGLDKSIRCGIGILEGSKHMETWSATLYPNGEVDLKMGMLDMTIHPMLIGLKKAWKNGEPGYSYDYIGDDLFRYYSALNKEPDYPFQIDLGSLPENEYHKSFFFTEGILFAFAPNPISEEASRVLARFARVFGQTYRRYLDLQKAEEQAREAQIEASLEKVRAVAMSMNKSDDLLSVCEVSFKEFKKLGFDNIRNALIHIQYDEQKYFMDYDFSDLTGGAITKIEYGSHPVVEDYLQQINSAEDAFYQGVIKEDQLEEWKDFRRNSGQIDDPRLEKATALHYYFFSIGIGDIGISTLKPIDESQIKILKRFRNVFDLAYRRYNDIALAEEQARETQIQLALERVRAKAMAMHSSKDLAETIETFYSELKSLGVTPRRCGVALINQETRVAEVSTINTTEKGDSVGVIGKIKMSGHPILENIYDNWLIQKEYHTALRGNQIKEYYQVLKPQITYPDYPNDVVQFGYYFMFKEGDVYAWTDKELIEEELKIFRRFTTVISLTYKRYIDLQNAEAQARESQIQLALERVRARTMAMHKSEELSETSFVLFEQLKELGEVADQMSITIYDEEEGIVKLYSTIYGNKWEEIGRLPFNKNSVLSKIHRAWKEKKKSIVLDLSGKELDDFNKFKMEYSAQYRSEDELPKDRWVMHYVFFSNGAITFSSHEPRPPETTQLLERFAGVFDLTYTRFLDLKKAEAQAREAMIEAALERVRSRSMAMHKSEELLEVITVVSQQLLRLGFKFNNVSFGINSDSYDFDFWVAAPEMETPFKIHLPYLESPVFSRLKNAQLNGQDFFVDSFNPTETKEWTHHLLSNNDIPEFTPLIRKFLLSRTGFVRSAVLLKNIFLFLINYDGIPYSDKENKIIVRFAKAFEQAYIRFLDLQKSEAQTREAQIEAALERVRSRTMAMQKSDELAETAAVLFDQMVSLGIVPKRSIISVINDSIKSARFWVTSSKGKVIPGFDLVPLTEEKHLIELYRAWKEKKEHFAFEISGEERLSWTMYMINKVKMHLPEYQPGTINKEQILSEPAVFNSFFFSHGFVMLHTVENISDEDITMLKRFASVFEQTYTRFLDLQRAEAQAREAEIEAALERVRSRTMAMQKSDELAETASHFFEQLNSLGIKPYRFNIAIVTSNSEKCQLWSTTNEGKVIPLGPLIPLKEHVVFNQMYDGWKQQAGISVIRVQGEDRITWTKYIMNYVSFNEYKPENIDLEKLRHEPAVFSNFFFKQGFIVVHTIEEIDDADIKIIQRFVNVFEQTYTRFLDLQKAEAQAREAIKQAALDRIRGEIASMRTSEDLNHITPIIWRELKNLEVPFFRCGVYIVDESSEMVQVYLTTPDGKSLGVLNLSFDSNEITGNTVDHWRKKIVYKTHWDKEEFISWTESMMKLGQIKSAEIYQGSTTPPESLYLHFVPFAQGMLYVGDVQPLTDEKLQLVKTLAEAFSIAYARYEDFNNLEEAKNKIEITLNELKAAQAQLIHSEKMASLGELTAGIAHEIKNPLNFVNNFSEVSRELLDEMQIEIKNNNIEEVIDLVEDLKQNLDKINQHGKRADSIVKGMLLHSRGTSGEKTPTDINDLLDQYVNLAYHGMRATNKEFNISIEKNYDDTLEKISVVPQDISRVFLNIINNACYAAFDKKKNGENNFSPTLNVSTKRLNNKVEIRIGDNGNGIPADHLDKIFQPFFTTKPSGEGTGLGLSLSYDIVTKVHGGDLKVETKDGEGTEFLISLPSR